MSFDDPTKMPLYHVQLETRRRIISYEIATDDFDATDLAKGHLCSVIGLLPGEDYVHTGGVHQIGYHNKGPYEILEAKVTTIDGMRIG
jgi:hypothetical protein